MEVVHISAECYPVVKAGGLGDVVGALPKYQNKAGITSKVLRLKCVLQKGIKILLEAAINPQKKNTITRVVNAPVLVGCLGWLMLII